MFFFCFVFFSLIDSETDCKLDLNITSLTAWTKEDREERTSKLRYIAQWVAAAASEV